MDPAELRVIIPVGGVAKRLKPLTAEVSKAVVRILNRPIVEFAMAHLALQGVRNFIFGVKGYINYKSLIDYYEEGIGFSARYGISPRVQIKYQPHVDDLGSADSVRLNMDYYDIKGPVMVVQGDNLFDLDLADLLRFHEERNGIMSIALTPVEDVTGYGIADLADGNRLQRFIEKPMREEAPSRLANTGIYLLSPQVMECFHHPKVKAIIDRNRRLDFGLDFIPFLVEEGFPVYGYILKGDWYDVGSPRGYLDTMLRILKGAKTMFYFGEPVPGLGRVWIQGQTPESINRRNEIVTKVRDGRIKLDGSVVIGHHCQIGNRTTIRDSCIDNFCIIGEDVTVERSAIMDRAVIGDGAQIQDSIIGRHVRINSSLSHPTWVISLSVIGDDVVIGEGTVVSAANIFPHQHVAGGVTIAGQTLERKP